MPLRQNGPGDIETGPRMSGRELPGRCILISHSSRRWWCQGTQSARRTVALLLYSRSYTGWWWRYYALGEVLISGSGIRSCGRTDHESCELSEHHCGSVAPLHGVCLPNWKWNLPAGQRPMSQGSDCVGAVRGAY
ncbi:hypothetical protein AVEN_89043-1 [Araneus ventricosus]|uniref:Uncharacterized protein n=1 Tax=Araneus ventricosus TaxID=182803 RepID=A0A4Y2B1X5_ARAVE|nr:hypothetical protein AVEN_89043-1 [Araneus ventricosus]